MCYYKLDYYDVSLEILAVYLQARDTLRGQRCRRAHAILDNCRKTGTPG